MNKTEQQFIQLIRYVLGNSSMPEISDWSEIWKLACKNHLEVMIYEAGKSYQTVPVDVRKTMQNTAYQMIARGIQLKRAATQISTTLNINRIQGAPLKGIIIKDDYPNPYMRHMGDLDFYVKPEERNTIRTLMESIGGVFSGSESGDYQFNLNEQIRVEFHGRLLYRKSDKWIENYPDWTFVDEEHSCLSEEGYALNLIGHTVKDLSESGLGIRYILDQWVYRHRHQPQPNWDTVYARLREDGIYEVAQNIYNLSEYLFGDGHNSELISEMAEYVLDCGLYGDVKKNVAAEIAKAGGEKRAILHQIFRNRKEFENRFVWLKKYPFMLPAAWGLRLLQSVRKHGSIIRIWKKNIKRASAQEIEQQEQRLKRFGF